MNFLIYWMVLVDVQQMYIFLHILLISCEYVQSLFPTMYMGAHVRRFKIWTVCRLADFWLCVTVSLSLSRDYWSRFISRSTHTITFFEVQLKRLLLLGNMSRNTWVLVYDCLRCWELNCLRLTTYCTWTAWTFIFQDQDERTAWTSRVIGWPVVLVRLRSPT